VSVSSPDFTTWPLPLMALSKSPPVFISSVALSVTLPVPSASTAAHLCTWRIATLARTGD
ncbi:hypothetical protein MJN54_34085, partial [Salmonella enterica subsp. enterica serovar Kentucky]|nr:hypothetical protein [Salmonella enterica subsp. enterica serovar Kentucky]